MSNSSIGHTNRTQSGATTSGLSELVSDGNEGVLHIPQSSSITGTSLSDGLVSSKTHIGGGGLPHQRCSWCILQPQLNLYWLNPFKEALIMLKATIFNGS